MKIVGILTLVGSVLFCNNSFANVHGFKTEPWQDCVRKKQCEAMQPKDWASQEIQFLKKTLEKFKKSGLTKFLNQIQEFGITSLQRSSSWYSSGPNPFTPVYTENRYIHAITIPDGQNTIIFTDKFFESEMMELTLLHELAHAYDHQGRFSSQPWFYEAAGFKNDYEDVYVPYYAAATTTELERVRAASQFLNETHQKSEAQKIEREFGMKKGLPRLYSMNNPAEAFADLVAFIYFDPNAKNYISPELIEYIDSNVLQGARQLK